MRVALATCQVLPEPDPDHPLLENALRDAGADAATVAWDDSSVDWSSYDLVVLRSTWNYHHALDRFEEWLVRVSAASRLCNPASVVRQNLHKRYLLKLEAAGVPVVPTEVVTHANTELPPDALTRIVAKRGWTDYVIKPATSAGSFQTRRFSDEDQQAAAAHLTEIHKDRDALVQPFVSSVETIGERSAVWIRGEFTHVIRKSPRFDHQEERVTLDHELTPEERTLAQSALASYRENLLYARVDMVRNEQGRPILAELELIEPSLFLTQAPQALDRFVAAIKNEFSRK